jgi:hypothetical protein
MNSEFDQQDNPSSHDNRTGSQLLSEIGRLLLLLLGKLFRALLKLLKRLGLWLLKWIFRGILALIDLTIRGIEQAKAFWNDNSTQERIRKIKAGSIKMLRTLGVLLLQAAKAMGKYLAIFMLWLGQQSVIVAKATWDAIIHLGPTLVRLWHAMGRAAVRFARWLRLCGRSMRLWLRKRQRAYRHFRQNKGFRGLLIDIGNWLKRCINNYVDDDRANSTASQDARTGNAAAAEEQEEDAGISPMERYLDREDDGEDFMSKDSLHKNKVHTFGRSIYQAMKRIVEDD